MKTTLEWLNPEGAQALTDKMLPFLEMVVDAHPDGSYTVPGILFKLYRNEWVAWIIRDEAGVLVGVSATQVVTDMKHRRVMRILFLAGDGWLEWGPKMLQDFEVSASSQEVYATEFVGRAGFAKKLPDYHVVGAIYRKVVKPDAAFHDLVKPNVLQIGRA
jgi:hypothetical protein